MTGEAVKTPDHDHSDAVLLEHVSVITGQEQHLDSSYC